MSNLFNWEDYLLLAESLVQAQMLSEASKRTAISRAYYAAFHIASSYLASNQLVQLRHLGSDHALVWKTMVTQNDNRLRSLQRKGFALLRHRQRADYDTSFASVNSDMTIALQLAKDIIGTIKAS